MNRWFFYIFTEEVAINEKGVFLYEAAEVIYTVVIHFNG